MKIWEVTNDLINKVSMLVVTNEDRLSLTFWDQFGGSGSRIHWDNPPRLQPFVDKKRSKQKPRADLSPFMPGSLALNGRARDALGDFICRFGQILEIDVLGAIEYYYNVTNVINCIDHDSSEVLPGGFVKNPVFDESMIPAEATIFKGFGHPSSIYVNEAGKLELEMRISEYGITGMSFKLV